MLEQLVDLAEETSSEKRRELLRGISAHFFDENNEVTDRSTALFGSIVEQLIDDLDLDERAHYAQSSAYSSRVPKNIALKMARDDISVAAPILEHSPVLDTQDLIAVAQDQSQAHLYAMAGRKSLGSAVTDVIVSRGENNVLRRVSGNQGAQFSEQSYTTLVEKAQDDEALGLTLSERDALPASVAMELLSAVPAQAREKLSHYIQKQGVDAALNLSQKAKQSFFEAKKKDRKARIDARVLLKNIQEGSASLDHVMLTLCEQNRVFDIALILAKTCQLDENALIKVICSEADEPVGVVCRIAGLNAEAIHALSLLRCTRLRRPVSKARVLAAITQKLTDADAERVLRFVRLRSSHNKSLKKA